MLNKRTLILAAAALALAACGQKPAATGAGLDTDAVPP